MHKDEECLSDIKSLEHYIKDELNIRNLTLTSDKQSYGVKLRAEPDHKTLGARLKGEFKSVTAQIKVQLLHIYLFHALHFFSKIKFF